MGLGAMLTLERRGALATAGEEPPVDGKTAVFTNDVTPESVARIKEGKIIAETHHGFAEWGWFGTETAVRLACGIQVEQFQDILPRTVYQDNADLFYPDIALPPIDWEGIKADCQ
jgi:ribose transport system substrate-binding protein